MRLRLMSACAVPALVMALAAPALAQETPQEQQDAAGRAVQSDNEIIVTAQGRAQALADVPLAVSAVSAETLQQTGANDIRALNQVAPSLLVSSTGSEANGSARIRGIGTVGDNPGLESSVAVFIDGVYRSRSGIGLSELGDLERIEVLRGPQGTLFGRNASAGLINIVSKKPESIFSAGAEATYGNYETIRLQGFVNVPLSSTVAGRLDGVYMKRDGFYRDVTNNRDVNNRDRYFLRGQLLFEPTSDIQIRVIGDYTHRNEECCGAVYVDSSINPYIGSLNSPTANNIVRVLRDLGQPMAAFSNPYSRDLYVSRGRSYGGITEDWGGSVQLDWNLGNVKLTSITGYRNYFSSQGADTDYSAVDLLYRAPNADSSRAFETFSQELRLNGTAFNEKLDWLVGGYFANEDLTLVDNLRFGSQYGRFATCRIVSGSALAALYNPAAAGCLAARPALFGAASPLIYAAFDRLDGINDRGTTRDYFKQNSRNWALFTHNIFHVTKGLDLTLGLRYTNERKRLNATFGNDNTACVANQTSLLPLRSVASLTATIDGILGLSCQGNSTAELNGVAISDTRKEDQFTGTAILSYKPTDDLLLYGSYSRGYKAGGFNLDKSALKVPILPFAAVGGAQALTANLQFAPETNNAFEIGLKYSTRKFSLNLSAFRQQFKNFQLNTFNGTVFLVQNINGCTASLGGGDRDQSKFSTATNFNAAASTTGACSSSNVSYGVVSQGVELEASIVPARDFRVGLGLTYADTHYRDQLVGSDAGAPLDQALRLLPGQQLSNAPEIVSTASVAWTPPLGSSGLSGLIYFDARMTGDFNTGSDLFPQKIQDGFTLVNGRIGIRGKDERWAIEFWGQNIFNQNYTQVVFNSPFQEGAATAPFTDPKYPGGRQLFSAYLAEPRTYGITLRTRF
ncbi:TonB-dependent receptor [Sphingomonas sp. ABOLD]|uniref:Outer membrane receptor protein involved in Fe transport n=1 Tax=Sphingomonas trueperi TaxID=53317 RepID=A0A7X5Y219_9SPHN|nr:MULTISPECIES: TonB-dependent receptor [Sphingomonas]NJB99641.1 outer membrane receptor protein involved in Fe transport [Sphingomonas trueperi]RSV37399.1 TonB-dependent receptor [Sphingomonas sp. ABOLE]RSV50640.1 TonB-dependent receptor [Sphingomonas sp. ABOLD]